jgi:hypothetical protein
MLRVDVTFRTRHHLSFKGTPDLEALIAAKGEDISWRETVRPIWEEGEIRAVEIDGTEYRVEMNLGPYTDVEHIVCEPHSEW